MKASVLTLGFCSVLLVLGCSPKTEGGEGVEKRVADLEKRVATLQEQSRDLRAKVGLSHRFPTGDPLADFFANPEFWECTYDTAWSDCGNRCAKQTGDGFKACQTKPEGPERVQCIDDNTKSGQSCLNACPVQTAPTDPPACRGGGIG